MTIPLCPSDLSFEGYIPTRLALRMEQDGLAQLVRQRGGVRKGSIRRAVMRPIFTRVLLDCLVAG